MNISFGSCKVLGAEVSRGVVIAMASVRESSRPATTIIRIIGSQPFPRRESRELRHPTSLSEMISATIFIRYPNIRFCDPVYSSILLQAFHSRVSVLTAPATLSA